ncbi:hypothetical protein BY996DRAFT_4581135 [Phakopsora pachyrhizi]|uniref:Transmembrane protein n=1 Tax=Phakopsora pachyrhizi TaxID=170000 RepID=A0AAV0ANN5_PHAPC|nr:hypothetical protein BY996DRAFT_4581135 [Phakopsora pachyrhizi]CAH7668808.1 hypothetical protein PPACK8108_LOCUS3364 [Phakopsora pachyrhizi]
MVSDVRDFYKEKRTCCLVIPLFQGGLVTVLYLNGFFATFCSVMSFFGPKIIGLVQPKFVSFSLGILFAMIALLQIYGIICAERNTMDQFRIFNKLSLAARIVAFLISFVFIVVSSTRHYSAIAECMNIYKIPLSESFKRRIEQARVTSSDAAVNSAMTVCDYYSWFQLGLMIFCWIFILAIQVYFEIKEMVFFNLKYEDFLEDQI